MARPWIAFYTVEMAYLNGSYRRSSNSARSSLLSWVAAIGVFASGALMAFAPVEARAETEEKTAFGDVSFENARLVDGGLELSILVNRKTIETQALTAADQFLRNQKPELFGVIPIPQSRFLRGRLEPKAVAIHASKTPSDQLAFTLSGKILADRENLAVSWNGWKPRFSYVPAGSHNVADVSVTGSVRVSPRDGGSLLDRPIHFEIFMSEVKGTSHWTSYLSTSLTVKTSPIRVFATDFAGLPQSQIDQLPTSDGVQIQSIRFSDVNKKTLRITVLLGQEDRKTASKTQ